MSDWFAVKDAVAAVNAGNDLIMPGGPKWGGQGDTSDDVLAGLENGTIKEADIDKNIKNILKVRTVVEISLMKKRGGGRSERQKMSALDLQRTSAKSSDSVLSLRNPGN